MSALFVKFCYGEIMKKNSLIIPIIISFLSYFLTLYAANTFNFFEDMSKYRLFEMPDDKYGGTVIPRSINCLIILILFFLINFVVNSINKNQGINFIKEIKKAKKEKNIKIIFIIPLIVVMGFPLVLLLFDFIDVSIGIPMKEIIPGKSDRLFPFGFLILAFFWITLGLLSRLKK